MTQIVDSNELLRRQRAMDAYQDRLNEMQKMEFRKTKEELDQAKIEKMKADVFKTNVSTQKTIIDAQSALQQIQVQASAAYSSGYAGFTDGKIKTPDFNQVATNIKPVKPMPFQQPPKLAELRKDAGIKDALANMFKMENRAGWIAMPALAGAGVGGLAGAIYSGFDNDYLLRDTLVGAGIGGSIGGALGHNYGKVKLKNMLGGQIDANMPDQRAFSLKNIRAMTPAKVEATLAARVPVQPVQFMPTDKLVLENRDRIFKLLDAYESGWPSDSPLVDAVKVLTKEQRRALSIAEVTNFNAMVNKQGLPELAVNFPYI